MTKPLSKEEFFKLGNAKLDRILKHKKIDEEAEFENLAEKLLRRKRSESNQGSIRLSYKKEASQ